MGAGCAALEPTTFAQHPRSAAEGAGCEPGEYIILKTEWARAAQRSNSRPSRSTPEAQRRGQDVNPHESIILKTKWARTA